MTGAVRSALVTGVLVAGHVACTWPASERSTARAALYEAGLDLYVAVELAIDDGDVVRLDRWLGAARRAYDDAAKLGPRRDSVLEAYGSALDAVTAEVEARRQHERLAAQATAGPAAREALGGLADRFLIEAIDKRFAAKALLLQAAGAYDASLAPTARGVPPGAREWDGEVVDFRWTVAADGTRALEAAARMRKARPESGFASGTRGNPAGDR